MARVEDMAEHLVVVPCKRRNAEWRTKLFSLLPREILFDILLLIPAETLHKVMRYVCKACFNLVRDPLFVTAHHHHHHHRQMSSPGLLIQNRNESEIYYFETVDSRTATAIATPLKATKLKLPLPARLMGSCNGLLLLRNWKKQRIHFIVNPLTKVNISLPPLPRLPSGFTSSSFGVTSSGLCKVVHVSVSVSVISRQLRQVLMRVCTVGVDTDWRYIDLRSVNVTSKVKSTLTCSPRFVAGFLYWFDLTALNSVAMDIDTETIYEFPTPAGIRGPGVSGYGLMSTESCLGLMRMVGGIWWFWKLTDVKTGEWTKTVRIDINAVLTRVDKHFYPRVLQSTWTVMLMNDEEFWFYRRLDQECLVFCYNLVSQSFFFYPMGRIYIDVSIHPHVHTLVSPKKCNLGIL